MYAVLVVKVAIVDHLSTETIVELSMAVWKLLIAVAATHYFY